MMFSVEFESSAFGCQSALRRRAVLVFTWAMLAVASSASSPVDAVAQGRRRTSEAQLLRESAARESRGDFDGAEEALLQLLQEDPSSSGGLFALERVLRSKGEILTILPVVDAFLDEQPQSSGVRALKLRILAEADSLDALESEASDWLRADPDSEVPYREVAKVYERAFNGDAALDLLYDGRSTLGDEDALSLEIGDLLAAAGDVEGAADEWARAVGSDAAQVATVTRRVQGLTSGVDEAGLRLIEVLASGPEVGRRRAGARIAIDLGHEAEAMKLSREVAEELDGRAESTFLTDVARRARDNDLVEVAAWAYDELGEGAATPAERRQFDQRIIDVSLAAGDTVTALEAQRRVAESFSPGSVDRRRATAQVIRLEGTQSEPDVLQAMLLDFREGFPNAPELDDLAATVAAALQTRGDPAGAAAVLEGIDGPKSSLERGYLLLAAGDVENGRSALLLALTGLPPAEATPVIQFAGLLGRVSPEGAEALAAAGVAAHQGNSGRAASDLAAIVHDLEEKEQPPMLAAAARIAADGGEAAIAAQIRSTLVQSYPEAPEVAEASLALARFHARTPRGRDEAIRLLEDLISQRPNAAVVPDARVELDRLRGLR
jgi:tetratricopeptide (TPR) repeat protein